jgi:polyisoprenoid-binding protein YceI
VRGPKFLDTDAFPVMVLTGDQLQDDVLSGRLAVRGVDAPVRLEITHVGSDRDAVVVDAAARIDRFAFGVTASRGLVGRYLHVAVHVRACPD